MGPKYHKGDRVIWERGGGRPHGKITDTPLNPGVTKENGSVFTSFSYIVLLDNKDAVILGEEVLELEEPSKSYCPKCGAELDDDC